MTKMTKTTTETKDEFVFGLKGKVRGGRLEGWTYDSVVGDMEHMWGVIYDSPAEKFEDGDIVHCSRTVKEHSKDDAPFILETRHSYYYLGKRGCAEDLERYYQHVYKDKDNWR